MFLLDSPFITQLFRYPERIRENISGIDKEGAKTASISYYEIFRRKKEENKKLAVSTRFFKSYDILHLIKKAVDKAAEIYEVFAKVGEKIN